MKNRDRRNDNYPPTDRDLVSWWWGHEANVAFHAACQRMHIKPYNPAAALATMAEIEAEEETPK